MTDKHSMVNGTTAINCVNSGSDHYIIMVMGCVTLNTKAETRMLIKKNTQTRVDTQIIGTNRNDFNSKLKPGWQQ